jgi:hypothetical protein
MSLHLPAALASSLGLAVALVSTSALALVLPADNIELTQIHVQFEWPAVVSATSYELDVVVDDFSPDPFSGGIPVANAIVSAAEPRTALTSELSFGASYAWRVRGIAGSPMAWGETFHFNIAAIPLDLASWTVTTFGGAIQPGLTLFAIRGFSGGTYAVAVDLSGALIWYLAPLYAMLDLRMLENGRVLFTANRRAFEATTNGQLSWASPDDPNIWVHHEVSAMPNGDFLALLHDDREYTLDSVTKEWKADQMAVFDRINNEITWSWSVWDHLLTQDRDAETYDSSGATFGWTHGNSAVYHPADDSIYYSARNLSRIVRIDYATGEIVYSMGFDMPSGHVAFGDDLFSYQHAPELQPNGDMLLFDNGNRRGHVVQTLETGVSKAVQLSFAGGDPPTSASIAWEWTVPTYNGAQGDADRLANGNTLVVAGPNATLHEVDSAGSEVWRLELDDSSAYTIYRSQRLDGLLFDVPSDSDGDGVVDMADNCPQHVNYSQKDTNGFDRGFGDVCSIALGLMSPGDAPIPTLPLPARLLLGVGLATAAGTRLLRRA